MKDEDKSKEQLVRELSAMREWVVKAEMFEFERKKAEAAIKESEKRFEDIALSSADWIWEVDREGKYTYASGRVKEILGYDPKELLGKTVYDIMPDVEAKRIEPIYKKIAKKKMPFKDMENYLITKSGENICVLTNGLPIIGEKGKLKGYRGVTKDITEIKLSNDKLKKERDLAQKYFDLAGVIFIALDTDGNIRLINKKGSEVLGFEVKDLIGKNWFDNFLPKNLKENVKKVFNELIKGQGQEMEYYDNPILTKDGRERIIAWHNTLLREDNGRIKGTLSSGLDITERKAAEAILIEGEARLQQIINQMPYPIEVCSPDGTATLVNQAFLEMMGIDSNEIIVGNYNVFKDPFVKELGLLPDIERVYKGESVFLPNVKASLEKIDDEQGLFGSGDTHFELTMFPVLKPDESLWRVVSIWKNITPQKIAEQHLKIEKDRVELYLDILCFEINNIFQSIAKFTEDLISSTETSEATKSHAITIRERVKAGKNSILQIQKLSESSGEAFDNENIDIHGIVEDSISNIKKLYPDHKIEVTHSLKKSEAMVSGDELIRKVFENILINSIKNNKNDDIRIQISHTPDDEENYWILELFDPSDKYNEKIFGPDGDLAIAHSILSKIGGKIQVESESLENNRNGSKFIIMLPSAD